MVEIFRFKIRRPQRAFFLSTLLVVVVGTVLDYWGKRLETPSAPSGIISFELAGDRETSQKIRCEWHWEGTTRTASNSIWLDFLFIPAYVCSLLLACLWASRQLARRKILGAATASTLAYLQPLAGVLDIMENIALLLLLGEHAEGALPFWAALWASLKFLLVGAGLLLVLWAVLVRYALRIEGTEP